MAIMTVAYVLPGPQRHAFSRHRVLMSGEVRYAHHAAPILLSAVDAGVSWNEMQSQSIVRRYDEGYIALAGRNMDVPLRHQLQDTKARAKDRCA